MRTESCRLRPAVVYVAILVALVTAVCYVPSLRGEFLIWDDPVYVVNNPHIRNFNLHFFSWAFTDKSTGFWLPLIWISFAIDYHFWGMDPFGFHLTAIIIHAVNSLLVVLVADRLLKYAKAATTDGAVTPILDRGGALVAAGVAGVLFGLHPLHVESVAWITERKDLLNAFFFLLALLCYFSYVAEESANPRPLRARLLDIRYLGTLVFFILSLLSKPMTVTFPIVLLIIDWYPLARLDRTRLATLICEKIPFFLVAATFCIVTLMTVSPFSAVPFAAVSPWSRILVAGKAVIFYLKMMLLPIGLSPLYEHPVDKVSLVIPEYGGSLLLVLLFTACAFIFTRHSRVWPAVWAYYLITLLPVLGLVQNGPQEMADRFTYLPSIGPFLLAGLMVAWLRSKAGGKGGVAGRTVVVIGMLYLCLLSVLLIKQIKVWNNSVTLWNHVIENGYSRSPRSYNNRGIAFLERGRYELAIADCTTALSIQPGYYRALYNRGKAYLAIGRLDSAIEDLNGSIASAPENAEAYALRGEIYQAQGNLAAAISNFTTAVTLDPQMYDAYLSRGIAYKESGDFIRAIEDYDRTLALVPDSPEAYNSRGVANRYLGRLDLAVSDYSKAISLNPKFALAYCNRGIAFKQLKNYEMAIADFQKAKVLEPDLIKAYLERAECFLATEQFELARDEYRMACGRNSAEGCKALQEFETITMPSVREKNNYDKSRGAR